MSASDPRIGTVIGGYRLEAQLGRGGMGVVYRAEDLQPGTRGRKVAIKLLAPELAADARFNERFREESQVAASIDHPNIVPIYEAGEQNGILYIAMRYVEGLDLHRYLQRKGPLARQVALGVMAQVAAALDVAHARGLVHRDIKPGNILLVPDPNPDGIPHVYLTDFGLTKRASAQSGVTRAGQFVGTIDYVAPEQIQGKDVDPRIDVYAIGCVFFECLTGIPPFRRDDEAAALWAHLSDPPPRVTDRRPDLSPAIDDVVARALGKRAAERYGTCREFVTAARWALAQPQPAAAAPSATPTAAYQHPTPVGGPAAVPSAPPSYPPGYPTYAASHGPPARSTRARTLLIASAAAVGLLAAVVAVVVLATRPPPPEPFPNANEQHLLAAIPTEMQTSACTRAEQPPTASASVLCSDGAQRYTFTQYPAATPMNSAYNASLAASGVRADSGLQACTQGAPGESDWNIEGEEQPRGRALCYRRGDGAAVLEWTHDSFLIHAVAVRPDGDVAELHRVWSEELPDYRAG